MAKSRQTYKTLRLILGDQLNSDHSWFKSQCADTLYVIAELKQETAYVKHHVQKVCAFFSAMQHFAGELEQAGHQVLYLNLDDTAHVDSLPELIAELCQGYRVATFAYQRPDEYRLVQQMRALALPEDVAIEEHDSEHFLLPFAELEQYFSAAKHHKMETFYRKMRKRFDIMMSDGEPLGGQWNFDQDNRNKLKKADIEALPEPLVFANNVEAILERLNRHQVAMFGEAQNALLWPINREQAQHQLAFFCQALLPNFGRFQDAMTCQSPHQWSLYHSRLSFALNSKLLNPREVIDAAVAAQAQRPDAIDLAQLEGFVRQILGWREFVRGIYWLNMPDYAQRNHLKAERDLPEFFWHGKTRMRCLQASVGQSLSHAYAHHIQRLMVIGNFCLLAGIDPRQVDAWYLGVYVDAIEWVEMPNTRGMSQFADGGIVGTKAYAASANYIKKMSDYCTHCEYKVSAKSEKDACPFNSLYWHFMERNRKVQENNPRIGMIYKTWDKKAPQERRSILDRAKHLLANMDTL